MKVTWKGVKKLISLTKTSNSEPSAVIENNITLTKLEDIANAFNKYFINISRTIQSTIKFSRSKCHDFLPDIDINSFIIKPVDKTEMQNILSLNPLKAVDPNSVPTKILKLLSSDISNQLSELFNLSFLLGVFPSILKSSKIIPIFKKESKLKCLNYCPVSLLSNIDKIPEKIMYNRLYEFLESRNLDYSSDLHFIHCFVQYCSFFWTFTISCLHTISIILQIYQPFRNSSHSIKKMNKQVNYDLEGLNNWINANKICLNVSKAEVVLFKSLIKQTDSD